MKHLTYIEPLEDRIAPATIINPYTVTFQDTDSDVAVVTISKPLFKSAAAAASILVFTTNSNTTDTAFTGNSSAESLSTINLLGRTDAQGMSISVKVLPQLGLGDGLVNVGQIDAANFTVTQGVTQNIDLGNITIHGNLGLINVGDNFSTPALKSLNVNSMVFGAQSIVLGPILKMTVQGNFNANMEVVGFQFGTINSLTIGGTLGADSNGDVNTGIIQFTGKIGNATIGKMVGTVQNSGQIFGSLGIASKIGSIHVLGSITGGSGVASGRIFANSTIGSVTVDGSVTGGTGQDSGEISGILGTVKIGGDLTGSPTAGASGVTNSGVILSRTIDGSSNSILGTLGSVTIGGNVTGGAIVDSGFISGTLGDVIIKGNLVGGSATSSGEIISQSTITIGGTPTNLPAGIGNVVILGNMSGGSASTTGIINALSAKNISIGGSLTGNAAAVSTNGVILVNSLTSLTISGDVTGGAGDNSGTIEGIGSASSYGSILIKGGVTGGALANSGSILVNNVKSLTIGKSLTGGAGANSGAVEPQANSAPSSYGSISIGGDVVGNAGLNSGSVFLTVSTSLFTANIGSLHIGGSIIGGSNATRSGVVRVDTGIGPTTIGGNITGGTGNNSGVLGTLGTLGVTTVAGNLTGSQTVTAGMNVVVLDSGLIQAGHIPSLTIGGDVISGHITGGGVLINSGAIRSTGEIGTLTIGGDITGTATEPVVISAARGVINSKTPAVDLAIDKIAIGTVGNPSTVAWLDILAGYDGSGNNATTQLGAPVDGSAQINSINLTGSLATSNIIAGVVAATANEVAAVNKFGTADNAAFGTKLAPGAKSSIASVIISGAATGDGVGTHSFGIVAESIAKVTVAGGANLATGLTVGTPSAIDTNFFLLEVS